MIALKNVYYMLAYSFRALSRGKYSRFDYENFENSYDILVEILILAINNQIRRGLSRAYTPITSQEVMPKGKINISKTITNQTLLRKVVVCDYDLYSTDIFLNQILKSVALHVMKQGKTSRRQKKEIKKSLLYLDGVTAFPVAKIDWRKVTYFKNNIVYEMLINICYMLVNDLIHTENLDGRYNMRHFWDEQSIAKLFERFILEYYKKHFPSLNACSKKINWHTSSNDLTFLPKMLSDILLTHNDKVLIIDAKYYSQIFQKDSRYNSKTIRSGHLYQIYSYVKNHDIYNLGKVEGLLLYAKPESEMNIDTNYVLSGNKISVKTIDMNCAFPDISKQLDDIVHHWMNG